MPGKGLIGRLGMNLHWKPEYPLGAVGDVAEPCHIANDIKHYRGAHITIGLPSFESYPVCSLMLVVIKRLIPQ